MTTLDSMRHAARIFAGAALLVASGCASTLVTQDHVHHAGVLSKFTYAAADRDMTTVIIGNPFDTEKATVESTITDAMQGNHHGPPTNFTTRPSENARPLFRVVMMFDPPPTMNSSRLCLEPGAPDPATASRDRLVLLTAFCAGDELQSEVYAATPRVRSVDSSWIRRMIASTMWQLIPRKDPFADSNCPLPNCT